MLSTGSYATCVSLMPGQHVTSVPTVCRVLASHPSHPAGGSWGVQAGRVELCMAYALARVRHMAKGLLAIVPDVMRLETRGEVVERARLAVAVPAPLNRVHVALAQNTGAELSGGWRSMAWHGMGWWHGVAWHGVQCLPRARLLSHESHGEEESCCKLTLGRGLCSPPLPLAPLNPPLLTFLALARSPSPDPASGSAMSHSGMLRDAAYSVDPALAPTLRADTKQAADSIIHYGCTSKQLEYVIQVRGRQGV